MSNDPQPLPDILTAPPQDAEYEAVYAEIMATERGRGFLMEYANRNRDPDTHALVSTIARLEAAMRDSARPQLPAVLAGALADVAAAIEQIEAMLSASPTSAPAVHFAAERIQDIAAALRRREVETALCDALETASREVGDAVVRNDAAAARASSAAALLRDLARRVHEMITLVGATGHHLQQRQDPPETTAVGDAGLSGSPLERPLDGETQDGKTLQLVPGRLDDTIQKSVFDEDRRELLPQAELVQQALLNMQAPPQLDEDSNGPGAPVLLPVPSPIAEREATPQTHDGENGQPSQRTAAETPASSSAAMPSLEAAQPAATVSAQQNLDANPAPQTTPITAANDPLAALRTLSDEELIALFS